MKLKSYNYLVVLLMIVFSSSLSSEEKIDIWKSKENKKTETQEIENEKINKENSNLQSSQTIKTPEKIQIQESSTIEDNEQKVYGIYEPANYDLNLNMWSTTKAEDLRSTLTIKGRTPPARTVMLDASFSIDTLSIPSSLLKILMS